MDHFGGCISGQKHIKNRKITEHDVHGCVQGRFRDHCEDNEEVAQHNGDIQEIKQHEEEVLELPRTGESQQHKLSHPRIIYWVHEVPTKRNISKLLSRARKVYPNPYGFFSRI